MLNGHDVIEIDYKTTPLEKIKKRLLFEKPAIVFTHLTFHNIYPIESVLNLYREIHKATGANFIHVCKDARITDRYMAPLSSYFSAALVGNKELQKNGSAAWKIPVYYVPYFCMTYDKMAIPSKDLMFREAVFTGSIEAHKDRREFISKLSKEIPIKIFKTQSSNDLRSRTPELSVSAKCILGLCTGYDISFFDVRPFQYLGTGACMIMRKFKGMDDFIPDNLYYPIYSYDNDGVELAAEHYKKILNTDTRPMQEEAFKFMQANYNSKIKIAEILKLLKDDLIVYKKVDVRKEDRTWIKQI